MGFFMHAKAPDVLYPAVQEALCHWQLLPSLLWIGFIAKNKDNAGPGVKECRIHLAADSPR